MIQITKIKDLETSVNKNKTMNNDNVVIMKMEEYKNKMLDEETERKILKSEEDYNNGRVKKAEEIEENCDYIKKTLKAEQASNRLRKKIMEAIKKLRKYPKIYVKIEKTDRAGRDYRRIVIDNYIMIYTIIEEDGIILISHIYYGGRNYLDGGLI